MLPNKILKNSLTQSIRAGSLLLAATLGMTLGAQAGDEVSQTSSKDKNVIQQAPPKPPRFYVDLLGGGEFDIHATKFISNGNADFGNAAVSFPAKIQSRDFTSTHDPVIDARLNAGYFVLPYLSVFGGFTYSHGNGHERRVGRVGDPAGVFGPAGGLYDLYASVGDYQAYAGRGGFTLKMPRYVLDLIHAPKAITPYVTASAGGKYLESQEISFFSGTRQRFVDTSYGTLYGNSWVFTTEIELGYELKLTRNASIIFENGYGYDTKPDRGTLGSNVIGTNRGGDRLYSTVSLGGRIRF